MIHNIETRLKLNETQEYVGNVMSKSSFLKMKNFELKQQKKTLKKISYIKESINSYRKPLFEI